MRAEVFRRLLGWADRRDPDRIRRLELQILMNITADAFGRRPERLLRLPYGRALLRYARFTGGCAAAEHIDAEKVYRRAYKAGRRIRRITGFTGSGDIEKLVFYLYRNIRITMNGRLPGEITVPDCYFSRFYTPRQCAVMSLIDSGIISGICGGGRLKFSERLTQGDGRCRACLIQTRRDS